jgi:hypothetical protein
MRRIKVNTPNIKQQKTEIALLDKVLSSSDSDSFNFSSMQKNFTDTHISRKALTQYYQLSG